MYLKIDDSYNLQFQSQPIYEDDVKKRIPDVSKLKDLFDWEVKIKINESIKTYLKTNYS